MKRKETNTPYELKIKIATIDQLHNWLPSQKHLITILFGFMANTWTFKECRLQLYYGKSTRELVCDLCVVDFCCSLMNSIPKTDFRMSWWSAHMLLEHEYKYTTNGNVVSFSNGFVINKCGCGSVVFHHFHHFHNFHHRELFCWRFLICFWVGILCENA